VAAQRASGLETYLLDRGEAQALMPALSDAILGAEFRPGRGHLWPFALVHAFAAAAQRCGAEIRTGVGVDGLIRRGDRVVGVTAGGERLEADEVVLATNAYTPHLLPDLREGAIVPARGQILVTEPVPPVLPHPFGTNFDKEYGRQTPDGKILSGGYRRLDVDQGLGHEEERVSGPVLAGIARCLTELFPSLSGIKVVRAWAGIMGFTADGLPLIGRYAPGLTLAAGFNGGGFSWAAITGKIVAAELCGGAYGFDLAPFDPSRFASGGTAWSNPFTAGERGNAVGVGSVSSHV
jgi:glycine/D-amino acid oxidase-like deaminating enzyme